jgi:eukaryotic-like serine/threonine-protein kinase
MDKTKVITLMRCHECGKEISDEIISRESPAHVCKGCRQLVDTKPMVLQESLIEEASEDSQLIKNIGNYERGEELGKGGMGTVYAARRKNDGGKIALKIMLAKIAVDQHSRDLFMREIDVMRNLHHPNLVEFYDHGSVGSIFYFAMEYCEGGSVFDLIRVRRKPLSLSEAAPIAIQCLEALSYTHSEGFVHRDLKPQNILIKNDVAKISDFGIAKNFQKAGFSGMTSTGQFAGSLYFMPCEQLIAFKYSKPVSDIWSMGASLYYMLTTATPYDFSKRQSPAEVILYDKIVPIGSREPRIPMKIAQVIDRAIAKDVNDRYQTAAEFQEQLLRAL